MDISIFFKKSEIYDTLIINYDTSIKIH